jgi:type I restriction enzyme S subunit
MRAYPACKASGLEWLGEIPEHWEIKFLKYAAKINQDTLPENTDKEYQIQYIDIGNVSQDGFLNPPKAMTFDESPSRARRVIKKYDTIISTVRTYLKAIAYIDSNEENLIASTGFAVLTPTNQIYPKYLYYSVSSSQFINTVSASSVGVSYPAINSSDLGGIPIWFPKSLTEQRAIAAYLDHKTRLIDTYIAKKQQQVERWQAYRAALINQVVTKGLNPDAPMKASGIEWLGEIPAHWEITRLKYVATIKGRIGFRGYTTDDLVDKGQGALTLGATHISENGEIILEEPVYISWEKYYESPEIMVSKNDILIVQRGSCGKVGLVQEDIGKATINPSLVLLKDIKIDHEYLFYLLKSDLVTKDIASAISSTAVPMLSQQQIGNFRLLLPSISEIEGILKFIKTKTLEIDTLIAATQRQLERLHTYRTALISDVVTGKLDVRGELMDNQALGINAQSQS